jgi:adenylate cyclase class 2
MAIEIEKKYRLTVAQRERVLKSLREVGAMYEGEEFEENTLYAGGNLHERNCVLRLRRVGERAILTYKERYPSTSSIKRQREDETQIENAEAMADILGALGFNPALVYEKRRETWRVGSVEVVVDELPFGFFMEIEGEEEAIIKAEELLCLEDVEAVMDSYPQLTRAYGKRSREMIEARFEASP